jgi:hypothetical protein
MMKCSSGVRKKQVHSWVALIVLMTLSAWSVTCYAKKPRSVEAKHKFEEGVRAYAAGKYEAAIQAFQTSYRLRPVPVVLFNLAESYTALDRVDEAMASIGLYLAGVRADDLNRAQHDRVHRLNSRIRSHAGTLRVLEAPEGSHVKIDGREMSDAVKRPVFLIQGKHHIQVYHENFHGIHRVMWVRPGNSLVLHAALRTRPVESLLRIVPTPSDVKVYLDGNLLVKPAKTVKNGKEFWVSPGKHNVSFRKEGLSRLDTVFEIRPRETREMMPKLEPSSFNLLKSPWFWGGVGLVVGGTIGYVIAQ